jgi:hypothetical protein
MARQSSLLRMRRAACILIFQFTVAQATLLDANQTRLQYSGPYHDGAAPAAAGVDLDQADGVPAALAST